MIDQTFTVLRLNLEAASTRYGLVPFRNHYLGLESVLPVLKAN
jgi:hypothetical protein